MPDLMNLSNGTQARQVQIVSAAGAVLDPTSSSSPPPVTYAHTVATANTGSTVMLAANASRKYALLQNDGSVPVYIKVGAAAVASQGIRLDPGGSFEMSGFFGNLATGAINGITASGTAVVMATEGT